MEQFKLKKGAFRAVKRKLIFLFFPSLLLVSVTMSLRVAKHFSSDRSISWTFFTVIVIVMTGISAWTTYEALVREAVACDDYLLTIDRNTITREKFGSDTITFGKNEITKIYKERDGTLVIMRTSLSDAIIVPPQIENSDKLELLLSGILPFS